MMVDSKSGLQRLKGKLPAETIVAHKTGSSGTNEKGAAAATNDVGIIVLPDGRFVVIAVFVSNSTALDSDRDAIIANIARMAWDEYSKH